MGLRDAARTVARSQASGPNDVHEAAGAHGASGLVYTVVPVVTNAVVQIKAAFRNYSQTLAVIGNFITRTRGEVAKCIAEDRFPNAVVERTCICKFVGTAFGVDAVSALRKVMGSHAIFAKSRLGRDTFVCNATCAAEGDNTVMELKVRKSGVFCWREQASAQRRLLPGDRRHGPRSHEHPPCGSGAAVVDEPPQPSRAVHVSEAHGCCEVAWPCGLAGRPAAA